MRGAGGVVLNKTGALEWFSIENTTGPCAPIFYDDVDKYIAEHERQFPLKRIPAAV